MIAATMPTTSFASRDAYCSKGSSTTTTPKGLTLITTTVITTIPALATTTTTIAWASCINQAVNAVVNLLMHVP